MISGARNVAAVGVNRVCPRARRRPSRSRSRASPCSAEQLAQRAVVEGREASRAASKRTVPCGRVDDQHREGLADRRLEAQRLQPRASGPRRPRSGARRSRSGRHEHVGAASRAARARPRARRSSRRRSARRSRRRAGCARPPLRRAHGHVPSMHTGRNRVALGTTVPQRATALVAQPRPSRQ